MRGPDCTELVSARTQLSSVLVTEDRLRVWPGQTLKYGDERGRRNLWRWRYTKGLWEGPHLDRAVGDA